MPRTRYPRLVHDLETAQVEQQILDTARLAWDMRHESAADQDDRQNTTENSTRNAMQNSLQNSLQGGFPAEFTGDAKSRRRQRCARKHPGFAAATDLDY